MGLWGQIPHRMKLACENKNVTLYLMNGRMRKFAQFVLAFGLLSVFAFPSVAATSKNAATHASSSHAAKKTSKAATSKKKAAKTTTKRKTKKRRQSSKSSVSSGNSAAHVRRCHFVKSHGKTRKVCKWVKARPSGTLTRSPIKADALDPKKGPAEDADISARSVPHHAYAVDGQTFFYQGKKYRVAGITGTGGSDMDKQRLQKALDGGDLKIESIQTDEAGQTTAEVTVDGKNLLDQLN